MSCIRIDIDRVAAFASLLSLISAFLSFIIAIQILREPGLDEEEEIIISRQNVEPDANEVITLRKKVEDLESQIHTLNQKISK